MAEDKESLLEKLGDMRQIPAAVQTIVVAIILGLMAWVGTELQTLSRTMIQIDARFNTFNVQAESQNRIFSLELGQLENRLVQRIVTNEEKLADHRMWIDQIWPRLRALQENNAKIKDAIELLHKDMKINLVQPEATK